MKRILLLVSFCFSVFLSKAQLRIAILGGAHQSKILEENNIPGWDTLQNNYSGRTGVHIGFMADLRFSESSNFFFQPGVSFYTKGRKFSSPVKDTTVVFTRPLLPDSSVNSIYIEDRKQFLNYIDIPLNIVYKLKLGRKSSFMVGAGPYVSFFYNGFERTDMTIVDVSLKTEENKDLPVGKGSGQYSTLDFGINGLAGFEFGRVFLTANYSRGLKDFYEPGDYTATNYKHQVMGGTIGIYLGKPVEQKPKDSDGDGTPDKTDKCPDMAGPAGLLGCPDTDMDGIADPQDKCPGEAGAADNSGCPYPDTDKDGVVDKIDQCPAIAGPADNNGCPYPDTDKDGFLDKDDKCPNEAGVARYNGCPIPDTDGDGINDEEDKCPAVKGVKAKDGCPEEIRKEIVEKVDYAAKRIQFKVNSADLTPSSYDVLDDVVNILKSNPEINVTVEGHTSSEGAYEVNMKLSDKRAGTVRDYLVAKGIEPTRVKAEGFGPNKPLNDGKTFADKAKNRRVELKLTNQ
jgi:outer membrane protein OmpA-like peptidoglycan-associated protein